MLFADNHYVFLAKRDCPDLSLEVGLFLGGLGCHRPFLRKVYPSEASISYGSTRTGPTSSRQFEVCVTHAPSHLGGFLDLHNSAVFEF